MPVYEYQCMRCGKIYEVFQNIHDDPMKKCGECLGDVTKLISNCSFQLKGTGWYITDYGRKDTNRAESKTSTNKPSDTTSPSDDKKSSKKETGKSPQSEK